MCAGRQQSRADEDAFRLVTPAGPRYARYVGRIGALAVALGVGVAVATGQGIGLARADEGGSAADTSTDTPAPSDTSTDKATDTSTAITTTPKTETDPSNHPGATTPSSPSAPAMNVSSSGGALTSQHHLAEQGEEDEEESIETKIETDTDSDGDVKVDASPAPAPPADPRPPADPAPPVDPVPSTPTPEHLSPEPKENPSTGNTPRSPEGRSESMQRRTLVVDEAGEPAVNALSNSAAPIALSTFSTALAPTVTAAPDDPYTSTAQALAAMPGTLMSVATTFVAAILAPFLATGPAAPTQPPVLWAVLAWVRREFERSFFNQTPNAATLPVTTSEDTPVTLDGFTDDDGDPVTVKSFTQAAHGSVAVNAAGEVVYTPDENYSGTDSFTVTVTDIGGAPHIHGLFGLFTNVGHTSTATINVTVTPTNDAPVANSDTADAVESGPVITGNVLTNDTDSDDGTLAVKDPRTVTTALGTLALNANGNYTYKPKFGANGVDTFSYTVTDSAGATSTTTLSITITAVNDAPVANPDVTTAVDNGPTITGNVLTNDTDPDGDSLTVKDPRTVTTALGTLALNANGIFTYAPKFGAHGEDVFTYTVTDPSNVTSTTTLTITITAPNAAPTGADTLIVAVDESSPATGNLLTETNASDPNGDDLTVGVTGVAHYGTLELDSDTGEYTYTPDNLGNGTFTDSFVVTVFDGRGGSFTTALDFVVTGHNQVFQNPGEISYTTGEDTPVSGNLFTWASDPDGDPLHVVISFGHFQYGTLSLNSDTGAFTYTPHVNLAAGQTVEDRVTYTMDDRHGVYRSGTFKFTITGVNDEPTGAGPVTVATNDDQPATGNLITRSGATDPDSDHLTVTVLGTTQHGVLALDSGTGEFTYTPHHVAAGQTVTETVSYTVNDGHGGSTDSTVTFTVTGVNAAPTGAATITRSTDENTPVTGNLLTGVADPNGDPLSVTTTDTPQNGTLDVDPTTGAFTYTPHDVATGQSVTETIGFTVADLDGATTTGSLTVTVTGTAPNQPFTAVNDTLTVRENTASNTYGNVLTNDIAANPEREAETLTVVNAGTWATTGGTLSIGTNGGYSYLPNYGYRGTDTFTYEVTDGNGYTTTGLLSVTVNPRYAETSDGPVIVSLTWGATPLDLDSYLTGPSATTNPARFRVSPVNPTYNPNGGAVEAALRYDDTNGYGPETIDINKLTPGEYHFYVLRNSNEATLGASGATVNVYDDDTGLNQTFTVDPTTTARYWSVFKLTVSPTGKLSITPINTYSDTTPVMPANQPPIANDDVVAIDEDSATVVISPLANDIEPDSSATPVLTGVGTPGHGTVVANPDGTLSYTPAANFFGTDTFSYAITDGLATATGYVTVKVTAVDDAPVAINDTYTMFNTGAGMQGNVLTNDNAANVDGLDDGLHVITTGPTYTGNGTVTMSADGSFFYRPIDGFVGDDEFIYAVADNSGRESTATVRITVEPRAAAPSDGPVFVGLTWGATPADLDAHLTGPALNGYQRFHVYDSTPATRAYNPDGGGPEVQLLTAKSNGYGPETIAVNKLTSGEYHYYVDRYSSDATLGSSAAQVVVHDFDTGQDVTFTVDPTSTAKYWSVFKMTVSHDGVVTVTPINEYMNTVPTLVSNRPPVAVGDSVTVPVGSGPKAISVLANDTDPDAGQTLSVAAFTQPAKGTVVNNGDGTFTYTPNGSYAGVDSFTYTVFDGSPTSNATATGTVTITSVPADLGPVTITLNWGSTPYDLDSHLLGPALSGAGGQFHVVPGSLANSTYNPNGGTAEVLLTGDTNTTMANGIETTTINGLTPGTYLFYVERYDGGALGASSATVRISDPVIGLDQTFTVDAAAPNTKYWSVFSFTISPTGIVTVTPINTYTNTAPTRPPSVV